MARQCTLCRFTFITGRHFLGHNRLYHTRLLPPPPYPVTYHFHPHLTAQKCNAAGEYLLNQNAPPPLQDLDEDWDPFEDRPTFEMAEWLFEKTHTSQGDITQLMKILAAKRALQTGGEDAGSGFFDDWEELYARIDSIPYGEASWTSFTVRWNGPMVPDAPWKHEKYVIHTRNPVRVLEHMARSPEFDGKWDYVPYEKFNGEKRQFSDLMSGRFAYKQADEIAQDPQAHGAMLYVFGLGADKTTVSVATGNQEFHPLYITPGNVHNSVRRAHGEAVTPLAFLAIPKTAREFKDTDEYRIFQKQIYHAALTRILLPLRQWMTTPRVVRCPDGHFRRAIFQLGPFIADYPEQVYLSGIVAGWCPKCRALPQELEKAGQPRFRAHTQCVIETYTAATQWDVFGVNGDVDVVTNHFPRADIHELLTPDLLHQLIKGTFKDHIVAWVEDYIRLTAATEREADHIIDEIDRRLAIVPSFPGLRRFPEGRNFNQWTGNDSKALMKVFLPAIEGFVPDKMVRCIAALLDFCYLARRNTHDWDTLQKMRDYLARFHQLCTVFEEVGVRPDGFSLPRQHALVHYVDAIILFGSPNGVCSSITESKHIRAVKEPWRDSNRKPGQAMEQIIRSNTRIIKMAAARAEFGRRQMLVDDIYTATLLRVGLEPRAATQAAQDARFRDERDAAQLAGDEVTARVTLPDRPGRVLKLSHLAHDIQMPTLREHICRFLHEQLYPGMDQGDHVALADCPQFSDRDRVGIHFKADAAFYAPSDLAGPGGMHGEVIRCNPSWYGQYSRYDTVLVSVDPEAEGMYGMLVARVILFLSFVFEDVQYSCALVEWFETRDEAPDSVTGMWVVEPEFVDGRRHVELIHIDTIVRACHLLPIYGTTPIPRDFHFSDSLDAFRAFYVNRFTDYHSHETLT